MKIKNVVDIGKIETGLEILKILETLTPLQFAEIKGRIAGMYEANRLQEMEKHNNKGA